MSQPNSPQDDTLNVKVYGPSYLRSIPAFLKLAIIVLCITLMVVISLLEVCTSKFDSILVATQAIAGLTVVLNGILFIIYAVINDRLAESKGLKLPLHIVEIILPAASLIAFVANVSVLFNSECYPGRLEFNVLGSFGVLTILVCLFQVVVAVFELLHHCRQFSH